MLKAEKEIEANHELCLAHSIHLLNFDALYYIKQSSTLPQFFSSKTVAEPCQESENLDLGGDDDDVESSKHLETELVLFSENKQDLAYSDENINELFKKIRKLVIYFKLSSTRNAVLQNYVKLE